MSLSPEKADWMYMARKVLSALLSATPEPDPNRALPSIRW